MKNPENPFPKVGEPLRLNPPNIVTVPKGLEDWAESYFNGNGEGVNIVEFWRDGKLLWRTANGINITPPPEIIAQSSHIIRKEILTKEEYEKFYGTSNK